MSPPRNQILVGDVTAVLPTLPDDSVDCVITSPPYFQLRNYDHQDQIGMERAVNQWVASLAGVCDEAARVLKPTGSLWLNLGDSYSRHQRSGAPPKSLLLGPEQVALELVDRGWSIRNKVIWAKTNPMPASVKDRLNCTWEVLYLATRSRDYFFDLDAIRTPHRSKRPPQKRMRRASVGPPKWAGPLAGSNDGLATMKAKGHPGHPLGKNPGDVWRLPTANYRGAHFATFPESLIQRPILASCPARVCSRCGLPWRRNPHRQLGHLAVAGELAPACQCGQAFRPGIVLDPFLGAGTVAVAAETHGRDWIGIEINPDYARLAEEGIKRQRQQSAAA